MKTCDLTERTIKHAADGYANAQATIRLIDTKAGALIGLAAATTGFPILAIKWLAERPSDSELQIKHIIEAHPASIFFILVLAAGITTGCLSLFLALSATTARSPSSIIPDTSKLRRKRHITVLFPIINRSGDYKHLLRSIKSGMTPDSIRNEYASQLSQVGNILGKKIRKLRRAVHWFQTQLLIYGLSAIACIVYWMSTIGE